MDAAAQSFVVQTPYGPMLCQYPVSVPQNHLAEFSPNYLPPMYPSPQHTFASSMMRTASPNNPFSLASRVIQTTDSSAFSTLQQQNKAINSAPFSEFDQSSCASTSTETDFPTPIPISKTNLRNTFLPYSGQFPSVQLIIEEVNDDDDQLPSQEHSSQALTTAKQIPKSHLVASSTPQPQVNSSDQCDHDVDAKKICETLASRLRSLPSSSSKSSSKADSISISPYKNIDKDIENILNPLFVPRTFRKKEGEPCTVDDEADSFDANEAIVVEECSSPPLEDGDTRSGERCRQCLRMNQVLHQHMPLCSSCIKHNHANVTKFRTKYPDKTADHYVRLFILFTLSRFANKLSLRCTCEAGCSVQCPCEFDMSSMTCVSCRALRGAFYMHRYRRWPQRRPHRKKRSKRKASAVDLQDELAVEELDN